MQLMWDAVDVAGHSQGGGSFTKAARRGPLEMHAPW